MQLPKQSLFAIISWMIYLLRFDKFILNFHFIYAVINFHEECERDRDRERGVSKKR